MRALTIALVVVLAIVIIGAATTLYTSKVQVFPDGAPVSIQCGAGGTLNVLWATYGPKDRTAGCKLRNVTRKVRSIVVATIKAGSEQSFVVSPTVLGITDGCNAVRELRIRFRCRAGANLKMLPGSMSPSVVSMDRPTMSIDEMTRAAPGSMLTIAANMMEGKMPFMPVPELTCGPDPAPEYAVDVTGRGAVGTVVWEPFTSRPERFAPVPELTCGPDPAPEYGVDVTGRGAVGTVVWEPFMSGTTPTDLDFTMPAGQQTGSNSLLAKIVGRSPLTGRARRGCQEVIRDIDTGLESEGISDSAIMCENATAPKSRAVSKASLLLGNLANAEALNKRLSTSYRNPRITRTPYNLRMGLGSTYRDPRFQPGPEQRGPGDGGYAPAPGTHAGGPTLTPLATSVFMPGGAWDAVIVKGFGGQYGPDEAITTIPVEMAITSSQ